MPRRGGLGATWLQAIELPKEALGKKNEDCSQGDATIAGPAIGYQIERIITLLQRQPLLLRIRGMSESCLGR